MTLSVDPEVVETWISLQTENYKKGAVYTVKRDSVIVFKGKLNKNDTLIHDESLEPSTTYSYQAFASLDGEKSKTTSASATTMDTTSHNFSIEQFEWGEHSSSILNDVAVIDENNIWAVGEIYTEEVYTYDSLGNWIEPYNAIQWDNHTWLLKRVNFLSFCCLGSA